MVKMCIYRILKQKICYKRSGDGRGRLYGEVWNSVSFFQNTMHQFFHAPVFHKKVKYTLLTRINFSQNKLLPFSWSILYHREKSSRENLHREKSYNFLTTVDKTPTLFLRLRKKPLLASIKYKHVLFIA